MFYVYALSSKLVNYIYVGLTQNIDERIKRHNSGRERTTRAYKPYELIFLITANEKKEARALERYFKSGIGKEFLKSL